MKCLLTFLAFILVSCAGPTTNKGNPPSPTDSSPPTETPSKPSPGETAPCIRGQWCETYTQQVRESLSSGMLSTKPTGLCPRLEKATEEFWVALVQAMAYAESNYKPDTVYEEKFKDRLTGKNALSVGLLQLSVGDRLNYKTPYCQKLTPESLKDASTNLGCGMEIIQALIGSRPTLQESLGRYWSTIRPGGRAVAKLKELMPVCR